jgi:hypothetical protein
MAASGINYPRPHRPCQPNSHNRPRRARLASPRADRRSSSSTADSADSRTRHTECNWRRSDESHVAGTRRRKLRSDPAPADTWCAPPSRMRFTFTASSHAWGRTEVPNLSFTELPMTCVHRGKVPAAQHAGDPSPAPRVTSSALNVVSRPLGDRYPPVVGLSVRPPRISVSRHHGQAD